MYGSEVCRQWSICRWMCSLNKANIFLGLIEYELNSLRGVSIYISSYSIRPWKTFAKYTFRVNVLKSILLVPCTENYLSSFKCGFLNIFSRQNLLRSLSSLLFLLRWNKNGAKKCLKNHIHFDFWDDSTLANQGAGKTIEKPSKELPWNQQIRQYYVQNMIEDMILMLYLDKSYFFANRGEYIADI